LDTIVTAGSAAEDLCARLPGGPGRLNRALNRWSSPRTAPDRLLAFHGWVYERTGGRIGHGIIGASALLLYTTGRRTGRRRCTGVCYARDGGQLVVAASNGGAGKPPGWFHNLQADPTVEVQVGCHRLVAQARVIDASHADYPRLWTLVNGSINGRLDAYQARTPAPIPLVALIPIQAVAPATS
jgi:deazaflavin-dependent oxidoreductase (nitroreductase family)